MSLKTRVEKLEGNIKPKGRQYRYDFSEVSNEELERLEVLTWKRENGVDFTPDERREFNGLCGKVKRIEV